MMLVRGQYRPEHRNLHVVHFCEMRGGPQVLGQTRSAKGKPGPKVCLRDIELSVAADEIHDFEGIDLQRLAEPRSLVRESYFEGVKVVAAILDHFCRSDRRGIELARQMSEDPPQLYGRGFCVCTDDRVRRFVVILDRRALAQELGLEAHVEIDTLLLPRGGLDGRTEHFLDGAGDERRPKHDHVRRRLVAQGGPELLRHSNHPALVLAAVGGRWSAHADERQFSIPDRLVGVARHGHSATRGDVRHELYHALLDHGRLAGSDEIDFRLVDVDTEQAMAIAREAREGHGTYVSETEDADVHWEARGRIAPSGILRAYSPRHCSMIPSRRRIDLSHA